MGRFIIFLFILICLAFTFQYGGAEVAAEPSETESPVKAEMRLLNTAYMNLITSLIFNNPGSIAEPFHEVHKATEVTEKAIKSGKVKLPKNNDKMKRFIEMDEQFHKDTEELLTAARRGNMQWVEGVTNKLLTGCIQCHKMFRN